MWDCLAWRFAESAKESQRLSLIHANIYSVDKEKNADVENGLKVDPYDSTSDKRDAALLIVKIGPSSKVWCEFRLLDDFTPVWFGGQHASL